MSSLANSPPGSFAPNSANHNHNNKPATLADILNTFQANQTALNFLQLAQPTAAPVPQPAPQPNLSAFNVPSLSFNPLLNINPLLSQEIIQQWISSLNLNPVSLPPPVPAVPTHSRDEQQRPSKMKRELRKSVSIDSNFEEFDNNGDIIVPSSEKEGWCRNKKYIEKTENGYRCTVCKKVYGRYNSVSYHVTIYHRNPPIKCNMPNCPFTTREARYIHFHKYYRHGIELPVSIDQGSRKCPHCRHVSKSPAMLEKHIKRHQLKHSNEAMEIESIRDRTCTISEVNTIQEEEEEEEPMLDVEVYDDSESVDSVEEVFEPKPRSCTM